MNVLQYYHQALEDRGYTSDLAQEQAINRLQIYFDDWVAFRQSRSSALKKIFKRPDVPRGIYLWGGVGRGKSFLMDAFYQSVPVKRKTRLHFHEFMRGVHQELDKVKGQSDPLDEVARRIARRYRLICFDEFHVSDIADAMILYRLLLKLFEYGTSFIMTSNYPPSGLYPDGLHRDRLLPAIKLIEDRMDIVNVDVGVDYRRRTMEQLRTYLSPLTPANRQEFADYFDRLLDTVALDPVLTIENRQIKAVARGGSVVWFDFATLCGGPRSQNDYLELASRYNTVMLSDVPRMGVRQASAARRFTWLVDVFYDHKVKLIILADCEPDELYTDGPMAGEFYRTVSRIMEMQSKDYLESERRLAVTL